MSRANARWVRGPLGVGLAALGWWGGTPLAAQGHRAVIRVEMATIDPAAGFRLAWGAGGGLELGTHSTLLLAVSRENLSQELGGANATWQTFLGGAWEYGFGMAAVDQRQFIVAAGGGILLRPAPLANAPYLDLGVGLRYPVAPWIRFHARVEGLLDFPRTQMLTACDPFGNCGPSSYGGNVEHTLGVFLGAEVYP